MLSGKTIYQYLQEYACGAPRKRLLFDERESLCAEQVKALADRGAALLWHAGLRPGDCLALRTSRTVDTALWLLSCQALGVVTVLADPHLPIEDFLEAETAIPMVAALTDECGCWVFLRQADRSSRSVDLRARTEALPPPPVSEDPLAPALVLFTSGSTGQSKAVVLSQSNVISNLEGTRELGGYFPDDVALGMLPLHHVFGICLLFGAIILTHSIYFPDRTDAPYLLSAIQRHGVTRMNGVPSLYLAMAREAGDYDLHTLRCGFVGGASWTPEQFVRMEEGLGMTLIPVYGMSECVGISCASWTAPLSQRMAGVGPLYAATEGIIRSPDGSPVPPGAEGEIWVRGPMRMLGYFGEPLPEQEFLPTGDLGCLDKDGVLHITGRIKDIIIRNGVNLSARRIEEALERLPRVAEAAVIGVPDPAGEAPCAVLTLRGGPRLAVTDLNDLLTETLAKNELPQRVLYLQALPRTASGKVNKCKLRALAAQYS